MDENIQDGVNSYDIETNALINSVSFFSSTSVNTNNISMDTLKDYVKYPMIYNEILRTISEQSYNLNGVYSNTIDYCTAIPTLSFITTLRNKTSELKKKKKTFNLILKILNHEKTSRDILRSLFINGTYVGILRDTQATNKALNIGTASIELIDKIEALSLDDNFMIQPLDVDYCKIIGSQNNINIAAFDMMYFDQYKHGGLTNEIKNYPKEFVKGYKDYKKDASKRWFILDYKRTIALKSKASEQEPYGRPLGISAFVDMKTSEDYNDSQYKLINELASSIYYLILPEGEKKGSCSLNKVQQAEVIDAFKGAVKVNTSGNSAKISTLTLAPNTKIDRLTKDSSLIKDTLSDELIKKISTNLGFASSALNAESVGSSSYSTLAVNIDLISSQIFFLVNEIAKEYTKVINEYMNISAKDYIDIKYLPISWLNKKEVFEKAKDLYMTAGGSRKFYIAAAGFDPDDYLNLCDEEIDEGFEEKYKPHITSYTSTKDDVDNSSGRPPKDQEDLSKTGQMTRDNGYNKSKKPSSKK